MHLVKKVIISGDNTFKHTAALAKMLYGTVLLFTFYFLNNLLQVKAKFVEEIDH
jgi:hypothetical protein